MNMRKLAKLSVAIMLVAAMVTGCGGNANTITVVSREQGSGTRGAFVELVGVEEKDGSGNKVDRTTEEATTVQKTSVVLTTVSGDPNAIGYISLGSLNDTVKALKIDGVAPSIETVKDGSYTISRAFNIATKAEVSDATQDFINFILSAEGQKVVSDNGFIQVVDNAQAYTSNNASGRVVVAGSSSISPVMQKLKEAYESVNGNVKVDIQESDSSTGMNSAIEGTCDIGMASRELKDSEKESLTPMAIALDGIVVIVNNENSVNELTKDQVKDIFTGTTTEWE